MSDLSTAKPMTFIVTADRERAKAFYGGTLGFALTHEDEFACVFDLDGTALRVSAVEGFAAQRHTVLGWEVGDIATAVRGLTAKGVVFTVHDGFRQDELGIWQPPGGDTRIAWFTDPDGNVLSLTQFG